MVCLEHMANPAQECQKWEMPSICNNATHPMHLRSSQIKSSAPSAARPNKKANALAEALLTFCAQIGNKGEGKKSLRTYNSSR